MSNPRATPDEIDPVRAKRAQVAKWTLLANRIGYLFVALAMALFVIAFAVGFSSTMAWRRRSSWATPSRQPNATTASADSERPPANSLIGSSPLPLGN